MFFGLSVSTVPSKAGDCIRGMSMSEEHQP